MPKWEYLFMSLRSTAGIPREAWQPGWINGREIPEGMTLSTSAFVNQLGADGWELISVEGPSFIFKRPLAQAGC